MTEQASTERVPLDVATKLAIERTRVAYERTVMAAVRTATSLITFGFTVQKFFQFDFPGKTTNKYWLGPHEFGVLMIVMGLVSLLFAWLEYSRDMRSLHAMDPEMPRSTAGIVAAMLAILGLLLLILATFRI